MPATGTPPVDFPDFPMIGGPLTAADIMTPATEVTVSVVATEHFPDA
jgi:hypothetical protein